MYVCVCVCARASYNTRILGTFHRSRTPLTGKNKPSKRVVKTDITRTTELRYSFGGLYRLRLSSRCPITLYNRRRKNRFRQCKFIHLGA